MPWNYQDQRNWKMIKKDFLINPFFCGNLSQKNLRFFSVKYKFCISVFSQLNEILNLPIFNFFGWDLKAKQIACSCSNLVEEGHPVSSTVDVGISIFALAVCSPQPLKMIESWPILQTFYRCHTLIIQLGHLIAVYYSPQDAKRVSVFSGIILLKWLAQIQDWVPECKNSFVCNEAL